MNSQKKVLIVLTSVDKFPSGKPTGWYISEAVHPYNEFVKAGFAVDFASISGGATVDPGSLPGDEECQKFWADDELRAKTVNAPALATVDSSAYDALFFAAGFGVMWDFCGTASNDWAGDATAMELVRTMYESGKPVGAVCHGPIVLVEVKLSDGSYLVDGKKIAGFTNGEEDAAGNRAEVEQPAGPGTTEDRLKARGAQHMPAANWSVNVQQDGLLFTGQNPQSASPLAAHMAVHMASPPTTVAMAEVPEAMAAEAPSAKMAGAQAEEQLRKDAARVEKIALLKTHWFYGTTALQPQLWMKGGVRGKIERQQMKMESRSVASAA